MGGMGAVYLVHDKGLDRDVALKLIRSDIADDADALERFKREIQLSSRVTHSNVLRVFDLGESDGIQFLTMQFVDGRDLSTILKKQGKLPVERLLRVFRQTAEGLKAAHDQGVIHRDLKPQNIMLDSADRVYVTDFGMAKSSEQSGMTQTGAVIGTPFYMSPEQVKGEPVGPQSDIFSLGVILYQMATGTVPFSGATPFEVMMVRVQRPAEARQGAQPGAPGLSPENHRALPRGRPGAALSERRADSGGPGRGIRPIGDFVPSDVAPLAQADGGGDRRRGAARGRRFLGVPEGPGRQGRHPEAAVRARRRFREPRRRRGLRRNARAGVHDRASRAPRSSARTTGARPARSRRSSRPAPPASTRPSPASSRFARAINVVTSGSIDKSGDGYEVSVRAIDAGDRQDDRRGPGKRFRQGGASSPRWPGSPRKVRRALGDATPESTQLAAAETYTAGSLEAAHEYALAQNLQWEGNWDEAIRHYQKALDLDPNLGRAYAGLAAVESNRGQRQAAGEELQGGPLPHRPDERAREVPDPRRLLPPDTQPRQRDRRVQRPRQAVPGRHGRHREPGLRVLRQAGHGQRPHVGRAARSRSTRRTSPSGTTSA